MVIQKLGQIALAAGFAVAALGQAVFAQPRVVPETRQQISLSFAPVVARTAPAVVNVFAQKTQRLALNPLMEEFLRHFGDRGFNMPRERVQKSLGSGVMVDASGLVVTNHHVIDGADEVRIVLADKRELEAQIVLRDPRTDLAVLKVAEGANYPIMELADSDVLQVGDLVLAIGNPFGVGQTVTQGIVSALARSQVGVSDFQSFIQTDAAINPGNSGGALIDMAGRLIGVNTAIFSRTGGSLGIGFAIPSNMVKVVVESAKRGRKDVVRPWLGAQLQPITADIAESLGLQRPSGALVTDVPDGTPAAKAGLKRSDVITSFDGQAVEDADGLGYRLATRPIGGKAAMVVLRDGRERQLTLALEAPPETARDRLLIQARSPFAGLTVATLDPALAIELRMAVTARGVVVVEVDPSSVARRVGFQPGDRVLEVNGRAIESPRGLEQVSQSGARRWEVVLQRGSEIIRQIW